MCEGFDFDGMAHLARTDPEAFEARRRALFEDAFAGMPSCRQGAARAALARVQVRMASARSPAERLALAMAALADSADRLQQEIDALHGEAGMNRGLQTRHAGTAGSP
jgi:hypothetical protein